MRNLLKEEMFSCVIVSSEFDRSQRDIILYLFDIYPACLNQRVKRAGTKEKIRINYANSFFSVSLSAVC